MAGRSERLKQQGVVFQCETTIMGRYLRSGVFRFTPDFAAHFSMGRPCGVHFRHSLPRHALRLLLRPRLRLAHGRSIGVDRCAGLDVAHAAFWLHDGFRRSTLPPTQIAEPDHRSERGRVTSVGNSEALGRPIRSVLALGRVTL